MLVRLGSTNVFDGVLLAWTPAKERAFIWIDSKFTARDATSLTRQHLQDLDYKYQRLKHALRGKHRLFVVTNRSTRAASLHTEMLIIPVD